MGLKRDVLCGSAKGKAQQGVSTSVQTVINSVPWFRPYNPETDASLQGCLIFVAPIKNADGKRIEKPRHVGFFDCGTVWHYENDSSQEKVISHELFPSMPGRRFADRYKSKHGECGLWVAGIPRGLCSDEKQVHGALS